jgi:hypothetical protein
MSLFPEYHLTVRQSISASVLLLSLVAFALFATTSAHAQINGAPASVTSPGFGGRAVNGTPSSVTSLGPRGYSTGQHSGSVPAAHHNNTNHHHRNGNYVSPWLYAVPVPYAVDNAVDDSADVNDDPNDQGGPTVFDRRGSGAHSYIPPVTDVPVAHPAQSEGDASADAETASDPTTLVFKDGRQLEVGNYAIVGATLFDLTPGHSRKIPIADLDLDATHLQNDSRGVVFQLPPSLQSN